MRSARGSFRGTSVGPRCTGATTAIALTCALVAAAGCSSKLKMMPTPVLFQGGRINVFSHVPPEKQSNTLDVLYATERVGQGKPDNRKYGNGMDKSLRLGEATVRFGDQKTSWEQLVKASLEEDRSKSISLTLLRSREIGKLSPDPIPSKTAELSEGERAFAEQINRALEQTAQPEVSIYVHGFRVDFEEGVAVAAQLRHFLGRRQVVIAYAWPCRQRLIDYPGDVDRAVESAPNLARLIEFVAAHTRAQHINVLGYSAGATLVVEGLVTLRARHSALNEAALRDKLRVGNVVLAAADIDLKTFVKEQLVGVTDVARYVAITVSSNDGALKMAARMHGGSRLGRANVKELTKEEIEDVARITKLYAIDVSQVKGPHSESGGISGHGYWYANPWVSSDVLTTFIWQLPPEERGLVRVPGKHSWTFPPDYPDRVHAVVTEKIRQLRDKRASAGGESMDHFPASANNTTTERASAR